MRRFRFSLEGALRARGARRRSCESDLMAANRTLRAAEEEVSVWTEAVAAVRRESLGVLRTGCLGEEARRLWALETLFADRLSGAERRRRAAEAAVSEARAALVAARREERLMERLRENRRAAHAIGERRQEQREADDRPGRPPGGWRER